MMNSEQGLVFNIQRFSIHDGPGIRTTVFMKGCNLRCFWCHNPESLSAVPQIQFFPDKCIGCGACKCCTSGAHEFIDGKHLFFHSRCTGCGKCAEVCYAEALVLTGKTYTPQRLFEEIKKDMPFYKNGGGATFSGGEPLLQADFIAKTAKLCKEAGISVAIDTAGCVAFSAFETVLPYADLFLFDIKHTDERLHRQFTGVSNALIKENLKKLMERGAKIWIRVPLIPGVNDTDGEMARIAELIGALQKSTGNKIEKFELMPFHRTASGKYKSLGMIYEAENLQSTDKAEIERYYVIVNGKI